MVYDFKKTMENINPESLRFSKLETLQVNLGNMCNQCCMHCHIDAKPTGNKIMRKEVMKKIINFIRDHKGIVLDITGGSPELNPNFKFFISETYGLVSRVMVRTNLTVFLEKSMDSIPRWYRDHGVIVIASMPCYTEENVRKQRGKGVFEKSIKALKKLNELGYGKSLELNLVYNPGADFLPASQKQLETDYKKQLFENYGIIFNNLFTLTNVPLGRFRSYLKANGRLKLYIKLLADNFNPEAAQNIMCRTLVSVDWQGILYNCDFNQAAGLPIRDRFGKIVEIDNIQEAIQSGQDIVTSEHCYCCTAGAGSSCTGALTQ
ncbi:hypothetical protein ES707_01942 [subsurface metagenome]